MMSKDNKPCVILLSPYRYANEYEFSPNYNYFLIEAAAQIQQLQSKFLDNFTQIYTCPQDFNCNESYSCVLNICQQVVTQFANSSQNVRLISDWDHNHNLACKLRHDLNIPGLMAPKAECYYNKAVMMQKLAQCGIDTPVTYSIDITKDLTQAYYDNLSSTLGTPFIIKPEISTAGNGFQVIRSYDDYISTKLPQLGTRYIAQNLIIGKHYQFDGVTQQENYFFEDLAILTHNPEKFTQGMPSICLSIDDIELHAKAKALHQNVISCLGKLDGYSHLEFMITPDNKLVVLEISPRCTGANLSKYYAKMYDVNIRMLDILSQFHALRQKHTTRLLWGTVAIIPKKTGTVTSVTPPKLNSEHNVITKVKQGELITLPSLAISNPAMFIICYNKDKSELLRDIETISQYRISVSDADQV